MFETIERPSAVDTCADALRASIFDRELAVGERLPAERRLAESFGVGRVTVRAALARLAEEGLVNVRQGRGYEVCDFERLSGPQVLPALIAHARREGELREVVSELLEVRRELARVVMQRISKHQAGVEGVREAVDAFIASTKAPDATPADILEADLNIVHAMLDAAGSRVLRLALNPFLAIVSILPELQAVMYAVPAENARGYAALLDWLDASADEQEQTIPAIVDILAARDRLNLEAL